MKGKLLEKKLVKWAIEGRRKLAKPSVPINDQDQRRGASTAPSTAIPSAISESLNDQRQISELPVAPETTAQFPSLTAELDRLHFESNTALAKSSETAGDRAMRRIHAEEMASSLRDDKLLSLTGPQVHRHGSYQGPKADSQLPLTQENMQRLEQEAEPVLPPKSRDTDEQLSTGIGAHGRSESGARELTARPLLTDVRMGESEQTVTAKTDR